MRSEWLPQHQRNGCTVTMGNRLVSPTLACSLRHHYVELFLAFEEGWAPITLAYLLHLCWVGKRFGLQITRCVVTTRLSFDTSWNCFWTLELLTDIKFQRNSFWLSLSLLQMLRLAVVINVLSLETCGVCGRNWTAPWSSWPDQPTCHAPEMRSNCWLEGTMSTTLLPWTIAEPYVAIL